AGHPLGELHSLPTGDVHGGEQFEVGRHFWTPEGEPLASAGAANERTGGAGSAQSVATQLRSSAAPASPDFSGWNWVAQSGPFSTAATNRSPPCSAHVTSGASVRSLVTNSQSRTP